MHAIATSINSEYYVVLQPLYGLDLSRDDIIRDAKIDSSSNIY